MNRSDRENSDPMSGEVYAVNNRTLAALCGLRGFGILGAFMLFHAAFRLVICVWGYTMTGLDPAQAGVAFAFATICFIVAALCYRGFDNCRDTLQRHKLQE
ncbi:hypothetical protein [Pantoea agglomerans]|uniref:hypothetical protein n=1 Tax=Enterobacter agglomerans TaxID=549 RepID=UPI00320B709A